MRSTSIYCADALIVLFCIIGFYQVYEKAGLPVAFAGSGLVIDDVKQSSTPFLKGDTLQLIDGIRLTSLDDIEFILDAKAVGEPVSVVLGRNGAVVTGATAALRFYSPRYMVIQIITAVIFIFLALFVLTKRKEDIAAQLFNWVAFFAALIIATTWGRFTLWPNGLGQFLRGIFNLAYAGAAVFFVHFTLVFPSVLYRNVLKYVRVLYGAAIVLAVIATSLFIQTAHTGDIEWFRAFNMAFNAIRVFFVLCLVLGFVNVVHTYISAREESEKRKLRWILLGLAIGPFSFITLWIVPQILTSRGIVDEEYIVLTMLSVPVTFAIAIVKYHILQIDQIFKRGTVYAMVLFIVLMIYVAIVSFSTFIVGALTVATSMTVSVIAAVVIAALFQPIREWTQAVVDKKFFNVRYNYREAEKKFIDEIIFCYDDASIGATLVRSVDALIPAMSGRVFVVNGDTGSESLLPALREHPCPLALSDHIELGAVYAAADEALFRAEHIVIAVRVHSETRGLLGGLLLGPKRSGFRYNLEDIDLLDSFCHQTALALDRVHLQRTLIAEQIEKKRLKELNDLKSYFVSIVTHELKTPLTSIKMFTELIEGTPKLQRHKRDEYLGIIKGESDRLSRLIDNVLDISKIEKGIKEYRFTAIELNECVREALATMQFQLTLHGFTCRASLYRKRLPLHADRDAIIEIIINLLSNAIKYSSQKRSVLVSTRQTPGGPVLAVEDHGIGIAQADLQKIFEPFERTDAEHIRHTPGTGLGLALVKHITEAHHAQLNVDSEIGRGTTFSITFPCNSTEGKL